MDPKNAQVKKFIEKLQLMLLFVRSNFKKRNYVITTINYNIIQKLENI